MATVKRHPVPDSSYEPDRPLNDLGREQLSHFVHAERRLAPHHRTGLPEPSPEDGPACSMYIAAVTRTLLALRGDAKPAKKQGPRLVSSRPKPKGKTRPQPLAIAAAADKEPRKKAAKTSVRRKPL